MVLTLALRTGSHRSVSKLSSQTQLPCHKLPGVGAFIFEKSNFGGLIHHSLSCSTLILLGATRQQSASSLGIQVNPWERGCCIFYIPALGLFIQETDCWSQEDVAESLLEVLLLAMSSPVGCWGLGSTTNRRPSPAEGNRPVKIPLLGCKTSTET